MVSQKVVVKNEAGLHARPGYKVNGKSILGVMTLAAESGAEMELILDGPDEEKALDELVKLFDNKFHINSE